MILKIKLLQVMSKLRMHHVSKASVRRVIRQDTQLKLARNKFYEGEFGNYFTTTEK